MCCLLIKAMTNITNSPGNFCLLLNTKFPKGLDFVFNELSLQVFHFNCWESDHKNCLSKHKIVFKLSKSKRFGNISMGNWDLFVTRDRNISKGGMQSRASYKE